MKKSSLNTGILKAAGKLVKLETKRVDAGWPPLCVGLLHQPKRPIKK